MKPKKTPKRHLDAARELEAAAKHMRRNATLLEKCTPTSSATRDAAINSSRETLLAYACNLVCRARQIRKSWYLKGSQRP